MIILYSKWSNSGVWWCNWMISTPFEPKSSWVLRNHVSGDNWINYKTYQPQTSLIQLQTSIKCLLCIASVQRLQCSKRAEINRKKQNKLKSSSPQYSTLMHKLQGNHINPHKHMWSIPPLSTSLLSLLLNQKEGKIEGKIGILFACFIDLLVWYFSNTLQQC